MNKKPSKRQSAIQLICDCGDYNHLQLEKSGWESETIKNNIYDWQEYYKEWFIQDMAGDRYKVKVSLRQNEDYCFIYVNSQWIGRVWRLTEAEQVVKAIKNHCH